MKKASAEIGEARDNNLVRELLVEMPVSRQGLQPLLPAVYDALP
jgi:hypothetical protein